MLKMIHDLMYIELKTGYSDDGPAWIGHVKTSKSKKTIYFNNHAFQKYNGNYSNYIDIEDVYKRQVFSVMTSGFLVWIFSISTILLVNFVIF